jgi:hypothetical protein
VSLVAKALKRIDIENVPELLRIVEEMRVTNEPTVLRQNNEDVAVLIPAATNRRPHAARRKTKEDHEAFLASAGGWKGLVDADEFLAYIHERRDKSRRPPVEL